MRGINFQQVLTLWGEGIGGGRFQGDGSRAHQSEFWGVDRAGGVINNKQIHPSLPIRSYQTIIHFPRRSGQLIYLILHIDINEEGIQADSRFPLGGKIDGVMGGVGWRSDHAGF